MFWAPLTSMDRTPSCDCWYLQILARRVYQTAKEGGTTTQSDSSIQWSDRFLGSGPACSTQVGFDQTNPACARIDKNQFHAISRTCMPRGCRIYTPSRNFGRLSRALMFNWAWTTHVHACQRVHHGGSSWFECILPSRQCSIYIL